MEINIDKGHLERAIRKAFPDAEPPPVGEVSAGSEIDDSVYAGKRWPEIHPMVLDPSVWALTEPALLYYLPAYLLAKLRYDWFDVNSLLDALYTPETPGTTWLLPDRWREKFLRWDRLMKRLTSDQKHVVRLWLETIKENVSGGVGSTDGGSRS